MLSKFTLLSLSLSSLATSAAAAATGVPAEPEGVKTLSLTTPNNVTIRYKEPGKEGVCETTPGVKSYSGYVDLSPTSHTFFYFFEARHDPQNAPITLWLNGGPGSDSLIGLFEGIFLFLHCLVLCGGGGANVVKNSARVISTTPVTSPMSTRIRGTRSPICCLFRSHWEQVGLYLSLHEYGWC